MARTGAIANNANSNIDEQQAASIGATVGPDGWWYLNGKKLSHDEADKLVNAAGTGEGGQEAWGTGGIWDRNRNFVGNALKNIAPAAAFIPGVGPMAAAGLSALAGAAGQGIRKGSNIGDILKQGAASGAAGYGLDKAAGALGAAGKAMGAAGGLGGKAAAGLGGLQSVKDLLGKIPGLGGLGGALGSSLDFLGGNGGMNALGIAQGVNAAALGKKSSDYADMAGKSAVGAWDAKAPLRAAGIQGMLAPKVADTSGLNALTNTANPFARKPQPVGGY